MIINAAIADLHSGSTVSLCPPKIVKDDSDTHTPNKAVQWLWGAWLEIWQKLAFQKRNHDAEAAYLTLDGDLVEGIHHHSTQLWSLNHNDWYHCAEETLAPALDHNATWPGSYAAPRPTSAQPAATRRP